MLDLGLMPLRLAVEVTPPPVAPQKKKKKRGFFEGKVSLPTTRMLISTFKTTPGAPRDSFILQRNY